MDVVKLKQAGLECTPMLEINFFWPLVMSLDHFLLYQNEQNN